MIPAHFKVTVTGGGGSSPAPFYINETSLAKTILDRSRSQLIKPALEIFSQAKERVETKPLRPQKTALIERKSNGETQYDEVITASEIVPGTSFDILYYRSNSRTITSLPNEIVALLQTANEIQLWNTSTNLKVLAITSQEPPQALCYGGMDETDKIPLLAMGAASGKVQILNANSGIEVGSFSFPDPIYSMVYLEASLIALSFLTKGNIVILDCFKGVIFEIETGQTSLSSLNRLENECLACGFESGKVQVYKWNTQEKIFDALVSSPVNCVCGDQDTLFVGCSSGSLTQFKLSDPLSGKDVFQSGSPLALQMIDPIHVLIGSFGDYIRILNTQTGMLSWTGMNSSPYGFCLPNPDGSFAYCTANYYNPAINYLIKCTPKSVSKTESTQKLEAIYVGKDQTGTHSLFATVATDGKLHLYSSRKEIYSTSEFDSIAQIVYLEEGALIAIAFKNSPLISIWDCHQKSEVCLLNTGSIPISSIKIGNEHEHLHCHLINRQTQVWNWRKQTKTNERTIDSDYSSISEIFYHALVSSSLTPQKIEMAAPARKKNESAEPGQVKKKRKGQSARKKIKKRLLRAEQAKKIGIIPSIAT